MSALVNAARGEVALVIDGAPRTLCLTLGALAKLEAAFDVASLEELAERLVRLSAADCLVVLEALLEGGGAAIAGPDLAHARIDVKAAAEAIGEAFRLALE